MAGDLVTVYTTKITEGQRGYMAISLDEWDTLLEPEITEGSRVNIGGALYEFTANENIDASGNWAGIANDTQVYGYFLVGGGGATVTCEISEIAPQWDEENQYWVDVASSTNRFWGGIYKDAAGDYTNKFIYKGRELKTSDTFQIDERGALTCNGIETDGTKLKTKIMNIGAWNMSSLTGTASVSIAHGLTWTNIKSVRAYIINDANTSRSDFSTYLFPTAFVRTSNKNIAWTTTNIVLERAAGGAYDNSNYNDGVMNRGELVITYAS